MKDATQVFGRVDQDLSALDACVKMLELFRHGFEMAESIIDSDRAQFLNAVVKLSEENKIMVLKIEDLEMSVAFHEANGRVDATRIQSLEERFDDLKNAVSHMEDKLCTCGDEVRVFPCNL